MNKFILATIVLGSASIIQAESSFRDLIDDSIGYVAVGEGVILIEGSEESHLCKISLTSEDFENYAQEGALSEESNRFICIPLGEIE